MKFVSLFICFSLFSFAQNIEFEFDYSQFGYDSVSNYVEFYYSFNQSSLIIISSDSGKYVSGILSVLISDSASGEIIVDKDWLVRNEIEDSLLINTNLIGQLGFILTEGSYKCEFTGTDSQNPSKQKIITEYLKVNPLIQLRASISDIQLSSKILQGSENTSSIFYKNSFEVVPVPTAIFGEDQPVLFFYTELYNLLGTGAANDLRLEQMVINSRNYMIQNSSKKINRKINSRVEVGKVLIHKLPTDTYTLVLNLIDSVANYGVFSTKKFFVYNPNIAAVDSFSQSTTSTLGTMFGVMSEEELDDLFAKSKYLATSNEINQYSKLSNEEGKREFMNTFWNARDDNPNDVRNEFFLSYLKRIDECNLKFTGMGRPGWKTDRGRVYLIYGDPNEIERFPNETDTRPYEIWTYHNIEGGVYFVFADITGFSDYQLVHSTKRGELRDESWARRIVIN